MKELFLSKKFQVALVATIIAIGGKFGLQLDNQTIGILISPLMLYIGAYAYSDAHITSALIEKDTQLKSVAMSQNPVPKQPEALLQSVGEGRPATEETK